MESPDVNDLIALKTAGDDAAGLATSEKKRDGYSETTILPVAKDLRACVGAIIDINDGKNPNELGKDRFLYQAYLTGTAEAESPIRDTDMAEEMMP